MVDMNANSTDRTPETGIASAKPHPPRSRLRRVLGAVFIASVTVFACLALGFGHFMQQVSSYDMERVSQADGIVILTGGRSRISDGARLLRDGKAPRLLISGVNPKVSERQFQRQTGLADGLYACCVTVGHMAANTIGNAEETKNWVTNLDAMSIILVTSDYHMPRSLLEFRAALPDLKVIPYAVKSDRFVATDWWRDPHAARVVFAEYAKYAVAYLRPRGF